MLIETLLKNVDTFRDRLLKVKAEGETSFGWYPYDTLANVHHLNFALSEDSKKQLNPRFGSQILDIGCADGDLGYLLESVGYSTAFMDYAPTNYNSLNGVKTLHSRLDSKSTIIERDLDSQFDIPGQFEVAICLGLLYHLKNPFYFLENLAKHSRYCLLSTRVFQVAGQPEVNMSDIAVAYLVGPAETNNDATNYWMFSRSGLQRLFDRCGWDILSYQTVGCTDNSNPSDMRRDERAFCMLKSRQ